MTEAQGFRGGTSRTTLNAALDDFWDCALAFGAAFYLVDAAFTALRWPLNNGRPGDLPWHLPQALWDIISRPCVRRAIPTHLDLCTMSLNIEADAVAFLGSNALCVFVSAIETGIIIVFLARFIARKKDRTAIQLLVYFASFVAFFQMGLTFASWWDISVLAFGNWAEVANFKWPHKLHYALTTFIAAPVQLFLIWRCWHVGLKRRPFVAVFLVLLVAGSIATTLYVIVLNYIVNFKRVNNHLPSAKAYFICFMLSLSCSAATDISVTTILLAFLIRSRTELHSRHFRKVLYRLIIITWESAVPPCTCAFAAMIAGAAGGKVISDWAIMLQAILGKLYLISLFVSLEGRASLASVAHRTHFQTLSNVARNGSAWPDRPDDADRADPSKLPDLPVRRRHSPIFGPLRKPSFTICFLLFQLAFLPHKVISSDPGADGSSWDPESTGPHTV
ncbi:hypothetical protein BJV77DRAFT_182305 [Russula vinacea]|nr:hypothetical protein BJV77DRAFT_182305 [Russula vinacea]